MSDTDRDKWQARYREGAYVARTHPSAYLVHALSVMERITDRALDLACGAGRNVLYMASQGYQVDAVDIAAEALSRGRQSATDGLIGTVNWIEHDLDQGLPSALEEYSLIIMFRYLDLCLMQAAMTHLVPGGYMLVEVHLQTDQDVSGPSGNQFRAATGELIAAAEGLDIVDYSEGIITDPDGSKVALARLLAIRH